MELALGTAQFGLKYGIAGRGEMVPADEVRSIFKTAADRGVRILDTATAYGDIEPRLAGLCGDLPFRIISKIPPIPGEYQDHAAVEWALASAKESQKRLGRRLHGLMFHNASDLFGGQGQDVWRAVHVWAQNESIKLGISCYGPDELPDQPEIELGQLPGNALDQRVETVKSAKCELHLRSVFLQGLLLLPLNVAQKRLPQAAPALERWHQWYQEEGLDPLQAALSIVKGFEAVSALVVGVDNLAQFEGILGAWEKATPLHAPELNEPNLDIIDPRRWRP